MMFLLEASTNRNRMSRMGSSEYPFNLNYQLEGIAVGLLHRYPLYRIQYKGPPLYHHVLIAASICFSSNRGLGLKASLSGTRILCPS
jgi:hypothetical protein